MDINYVNSHLIFDTIVGSKAYGIDTPESDQDETGIMIPGREYFFGTQRFEQFQGFEGKDKTVYNIVKAISLIADANPNMLELLWMPERCWLKMTPYWMRFIDNRQMFLSRKLAYTFSGYSISQIFKIRTHRQFILDGKVPKPERKDYGLPEVSIFPSVNFKPLLYSILEIIPRDKHEDFLASMDEVYSIYLMPSVLKYTEPSLNPVTIEWLNKTLKSQATSLTTSHQYVKDEFVEMAKKELVYYSAKQKYEQYCSWEKHRNKKRAEMEIKWGYDLKYASTAIRLLRVGMEALSTGKIIIDRTGVDAEELRSIRQGAWSYEKVEEYAKDAEKKIMELYKTSSVLPKYPDREKIDKLCVEVVDQYLRDHDGK